MPSIKDLHQVACDFIPPRSIRAHSAQNVLHRDNNGSDGVRSEPSTLQHPELCFGRILEMQWQQ